MNLGSAKEIRDTAIRRETRSALEQIRNKIGLT